MCDDVTLYRLFIWSASLSSILTSTASVDVAVISNMKSSRQPILRLFCVLPAKCDALYRVNIRVVSGCGSRRLWEECDDPASQNSASPDLNVREGELGILKILPTTIKIKSKTALTYSYLFLLQFKYILLFILYAFVFIFVIKLIIIYFSLRLLFITAFQVTYI